MQLLLNKMAENGYCKSGVGQIHTYLRACFEYATDEEIVLKNPAEGGDAQYPKEGVRTLSKYA
jgi:hypothetical protein